MKPANETSHRFFVDTDGAVVFFRGINLSRQSAYPTQKYDITFVGRPFLDDEAEDSIRLIKNSGFNLIRLVVPWEALEHREPGKYDEFYIEYLVRILCLAQKYGLYVSILPFQEFWSRATGGSGAPSWTLDLVGVDTIRISLSELQPNLQGTDRPTHRDRLLAYYSYPVATMFTLFYAGKMFAPYLIIEGTNIQEYLQSKFIQAFTYLLNHLSPFTNLVGASSLSYPFSGYIGIQNLSESLAWGVGFIESVVPFLEMYASEGNSIELPVFFCMGNKKFSFHKTSKNSERLSIWKEKKFCVWRMHGVWNYDPNGAPMLLRSNYFSQYKNQPVNFRSDCFDPFVSGYQKSILSVSHKLKVFIEHPIQEEKVVLPETNEQAVPVFRWNEPVSFLPWFPWKRLALDVSTNEPVIGKKRMKALYKRSVIQNLPKAHFTTEAPPCFFGEIEGVYHTSKKSHYLKEGLSKETILDILSELENSLSDYCIWDIEPYSSTEDKLEQTYFPGPYPVSTRGIPISLSFSAQENIFRYSFKRGSFEPGECVIYIPAYLYPNGFSVLVNAGNFEYRLENQTLLFKGQEGVEIYGISIHPK
jgi:hypothetical protein